MLPGWRWGRHLHAHTRRAFDPLGADDDGGTHPPRVSMANPRLQSSATPAGPAASRNACTDVGMGTAVSQRHAAGMATGTAAPRMRCTDIGMGTAVPPRHAAGMTAGTASLPRFCSGMATRTAAPRGSNRHTLCKVSHGSRLVESRHPRDAGTRLTRTHDERSTPLGPMMMGARAFRGFAALTRGYRVVRPLRGRQLHGMPVQM